MLRYFKITVVLLVDILRIITNKIVILLYIILTKTYQFVSISYEIYNIYYLTKQSDNTFCSKYQKFNTKKKRNMKNKWKIYKIYEIWKFLGDFCLNAWYNFKIQIKKSIGCLWTRLYIHKYNTKLAIKKFNQIILTSDLKKCTLYKYFT